MEQVNEETQRQTQGLELDEHQEILKRLTKIETQVQMTQESMTQLRKFMFWKFIFFAAAVLLPALALPFFIKLFMTMYVGTFEQLL